MNNIDDKCFFLMSANTENELNYSDIKLYKDNIKKLISDKVKLNEKLSDPTTTLEEYFDIELALTCIYHDLLCSEISLISGFHFNG